MWCLLLSALPVFHSQTTMEDLWRKSCFGFLDYKTEKFALIRNRKVGVLHRLLQLVILGYILGWVLLAKKGYQEKDNDPHVSVITKLKGVSATHIKEFGHQLWDVADYVKPAQGENVFFLVTNLIATPKQVQGTCPEHPSVPNGNCKRDLDCPAGQPVVHGNGVKTGKCVHYNTSRSTCEIYGWCPVENRTLPRKPLLAAAENFTLFIKNTVNFTKFNFSRTNTLKTTDDSYFKGCRYEALADPYCPVFRIHDMVKATGESFEELARWGGAIGLRIDWNCDLDQPPSACQPCYSFSLLEKKFNFRLESLASYPLLSTWARGLCFLVPPPFFAISFCCTLIPKPNSIGARSMRRQSRLKTKSRRPHSFTTRHNVRRKRMRLPSGQDLCLQLWRSLAFLEAEIF